MRRQRCCHSLLPRGASSCCKLLHLPRLHLLLLLLPRLQQLDL
jgi:hypothetical protein